MEFLQITRGAWCRICLCQDGWMQQLQQQQLAYVACNPFSGDAAYTGIWQNAHVMPGAVLQGWLASYMTYFDGFLVPVAVGWLPG